MLMRDRSCDDHMRLQLSWSQVFTSGRFTLQKEQNKYRFYVITKGQAVCEGCRKWRGSNQSSSLALGRLTECVPAGNETAPRRLSFLFSAVWWLWGLGVRWQHYHTPHLLYTMLVSSSPWCGVAHLRLDTVAISECHLRFQGMSLLVQSDSARMLSVCQLKIKNRSV